MGEEVIFLKGDILFFVVFEGKKVLLVVGNILIFGCLGELFDEIWLFFWFDMKGFCVFGDMDCLCFLLCIVLLIWGIICLGLLDFFNWFYFEKDDLVNWSFFCCRFGCFLCFCLVSFFRGRFVMFKLYIVLVIILVKVFIVI